MVREEGRLVSRKKHQYNIVWSKHEKFENKKHFCVASYANVVWEGYEKHNFWPITDAVQEKNNEDKTPVNFKHAYCAKENIQKCYDLSLEVNNSSQSDVPDYSGWDAMVLIKERQVDGT